MTTGHAPLPPSGAFRWVLCPMSASLELAYPEADIAAAAEGIGAHWVVQEVLEGRPWPALHSLTPNGQPVTREMHEGTQLVIEAITSRLGAGWHGHLIVERRVQITRIHPTHCWGTPDIVAWVNGHDGKRWLFLFDYKFGHGVVDVFENEQLICYAVGLITEAGLNDWDVTVVACIIQPRAHHRDGPVRYWQFNAADIRADVNILRMQAQKALSADPVAVPTPKGCRDCAGRHVCEALQREAYAAAEKGKHYLPLDLSPLALGRELVALKRAESLLSARVKGLEAQRDSIIKNGGSVPFWIAESVPGRLRWNLSPHEIITLGDVHGVDLRQEPEPITPTQALNLKKLPKDTINLFAARPTGAMQIVFDDGNKTRLTFGPSNT